MAQVYVADDPQGVRVEYRDRKRAWWLLSVVYPLLPFTGMALHTWTGAQIALGLPLLISYGLMPLLDFFIGEDENNPPEAVVPQLEQDRYYRWLTWATVPLHFVALIGCAWWVGTHDLSWWAVLMLAYIAGTDSGLGINTGHELGHKYTRTEQWAELLDALHPVTGAWLLDLLVGRGKARVLPAGGAGHDARVALLGWLPADGLASLEAKVRRYLADHEALTPTDFKDLTGLTRRAAIPLLEWLDKRRITRRDGDRRLRGPAA